VETNELFESNSDVILTRQTCGHRSSRVAGSKRRALAFYFSVRIWYTFFKSKSRGMSDLGVCMTSVLAKRMRLRSAEFRRIPRPNMFLNRGGVYWDSLLETEGKLQQSCLKVPQAEHNRCDRKDNPWAFVFDFRTDSNLRPESTIPMHPHPHRSVDRYFSISVPKWPLIFWIPGRYVSW